MFLAGKLNRLSQKNKTKKMGLIPLTVGAARQGNGCGMQSHFSLGDMLSPSAPTCKTAHLFLEGKYLGGGRRGWGRGGVVGRLYEDREGGGSCLQLPSFNISSSWFPKGHSPFEGPRKSFCLMALVWSVIHKAPTQPLPLFKCVTSTSHNLLLSSERVKGLQGSSAC